MRPATLAGTALRCTQTSTPSRAEPHLVRDCYAACAASQELVSRFDVETILLWTALLLKKRVMMCAVHSHALAVP